MIQEVFCGKNILYRLLGFFIFYLHFLTLTKTFKHKKIK